ncbi:MAG: DUF1573 domain-containing protein [Clostridium sp.]|nr:DUF1573 domain-containing protein [Clostridium sp.]
MIFRKTALLGGLLALSLEMGAQAHMVVDNDVANMGEVMFQMPQKATFRVKNKGTAPLTITQVHPSCGCMQADWTRQPIAPGEEGEITTLYDARMLGVFQKDLEVYTNESDEPVYLHLQGRVVSHMTDYTGAFPVEFGHLRMSTDHIEFDDVNRGDNPVAEIQVVNTSRKSYKPELMHLPPYLEAQYYPEVLAGGRVGRIVLTLDSRKLTRMGLNETSVYLARHLGDRVTEENEIAVSAVLLPDFSGLTAEQQAQAPELKLSADSLDLGVLGTKKRKSGVVTLTNTGRSTLEIRSLQVFGGALSVKLGNRKLAPGKSTKLHISVQADRLKKAKARPRVLLITNDPKRPKEIITIQVKP